MFLSLLPPEKTHFPPFSRINRTQGRLFAGLGPTSDKRHKFAPERFRESLVYFGAFFWCVFVARLVVRRNASADRDRGVVNNSAEFTSKSAANPHRKRAIFHAIQERRKHASRFCHHNGNAIRVSKNAHFLSERYTLCAPQVPMLPKWQRKRLPRIAIKFPERAAKRFLCGSLRLETHRCDWRIIVNDTPSAVIGREFSCVTKRPEMRDAP